MPLLLRKIDSSWLLALASAGLLGGIALGYFWRTAYFGEIQWLVIALALLAIVLIKRIVIFILLAVVAGIILGLWRGGIVMTANNSYQQFIGQNVTLEGTISDDVAQKNGQSGMKLSNIKINNTELGGTVWSSTSTSLELKRGDVVLLNGRLSDGFGKFAASMSYAKLADTRTYSNNFALQLRDKFTSGLKHAVPNPEASLGAGYLDGQHNNLPDNLTKNLQLVGLIHIVIAGGYNVTILVRFVRRLLGKVSKYLAALGATSVLASMLLVSGFSAPMSRTIVITMLSLLAWYYGRKIHPLVLLPVSAAITALIDPTFVKGAVGWYLTFIAYGGLITLGPLLKRYFWHEPKPSNARQIFVDTLAVSIVTMPLLAYAFQQYSIYGLPANLLVLPLMPITMLATVLAGIGGVFLPVGLAQIIGWPARVLLTYTDKVTNYLANSPGAHYSASFSISMLVAGYLLICLLIIWLWRKTGYNFRDENIVD